MIKNKVHFKYCFIDGKRMPFWTLPKFEIKMSFTEAKTLNMCPYKAFNETWEMTGLSVTDMFAHGTMGHYLMAEFIYASQFEDFDYEVFKQEAMQLAFDTITMSKSKARERFKPELTHIGQSSLTRLYVSSRFSMDKYLDKIENVIGRFPEVYRSFGGFANAKNIYLESGVYSTKERVTTFGKIDLLVEHLDGTYTVIDHKHSLNTLSFNSLQNPYYASILGKKIKRLGIYEMSTGHSILYNDIEAHLKEAGKFAKSASALLESGEHTIRVGDHCAGCRVDCMEEQVDEDGYVEL